MEKLEYLHMEGKARKGELEDGRGALAKKEPLFSKLRERLVTATSIGIFTVGGVLSALGCGDGRKNENTEDAAHEDIVHDDMLTETTEDAPAAEDAGETEDFAGEELPPAPEVVWTAEYTTEYAAEDLAKGIAVDGDGNVYAVGNVVEDGYHRLWIAKCNGGGEFEWMKTYRETIPSSKDGKGIALDADGNIYITGDASGPDALIAKCSNTGDVIWAKTYNGPDNEEDDGRGIAVDDSGNAYVIGYSFSSTEHEDVWLAKYDTDGELVWDIRYSGPNAAWEEGNAVALDAEGNVYAAGHTAAPEEQFNIWVAKYDNDGNQVWFETYNTPYSYHGFIGADDELTGVVIGDGVYVAGYAEVPAQNKNVWVGKYGKDGGLGWSVMFSGSSVNESGEGRRDAGNGIALDGNGNIYTAGYTELSENNYALWIGKYTSEGEDVSRFQYDGGSMAHAITADGEYVYVAGYRTASGSGRNVLIMKLRY